jgi:hypothetical protein
MLTRSAIVRLPMSKEEFLSRAESLDERLQDWEQGEAIQVGPAH